MQNLIARLLLIVGTIATLFSTSMAYGEELSNSWESFMEIAPCAKTYVSSEQIHFFQSHILIEMDHNMLFLTDALYQDIGGIFIATKSKSGKQKCSFYEWDCSKCGTCNAAWRDHCGKCGKYVYD